MQTQHFNEQFAPHFEGLAGEWQMELLEGSSWGSFSSSNSNLTINGAAGSRYGAMYPTLEESDLYGYTVSSRLVSYSGTNALMNLYSGSGRGDFSNFVEFGIEGGVLKVYTSDAVGNWSGPAASTPALLTIEAGPYGPSGRTIYFYYNNSLVYSLKNDTHLPNKDYQVFLYGYGASTTTWDFMSPERWGDWQEDGYADRAAYSIDSVNAYNGRYSARIDLTQHTNGRKGISIPDIEVTAGHPYTFSIWLRQNAMTGPVTVTLGPSMGDSASYVPYATGSITGVTGNWAKYTLTLTPNTSNQQAKLFIGFGATGTLWLDMPSLMPTHASEVSDGGFRTDWVNALVDAKPNMLRWPGGIIADWQHWQDGVGSRDSRPPIYYGQWDSVWMSNDVGTDEFLKFTANHGITPFLNVNYGTGTPTEAANWVQYANGATSTAYGAQRAANGHAIPYAVKFWGIGNETWGAWTPGWTSDPNVFSSGYTAIQTAMAAQDPTLNFTAEGGDGNNNSNTWNQVLLQNNASRMNNLAIHYYSPQGLPQGYSSLDVYRASVGAPVTYASRMLATQNTVLNATDRNIKLAIEEYNAMYFHDDQRRTRSTEAALQVAGFLNSMVRNPHFADFNHYSEVANFWDGGSIRTSVRGMLVTPAYHVLKMFGNYRGPISVQTSVSGSPTYNAPAMGNLPAVSGIPMLDAAATKSADGTELYISVVNRDETNAQATTLNLSNTGTIGATATVYSVGGGAGYLTKNTWQNPNAVPLATNTISGVGSSFTYTFPAHSYTVIKITVSASATTVPSIVGKVVNASGTGLAGATVQVIGGGSAITNSSGYYLIPVSGAGTYDLTATLTGYTTGHKYAVISDAGGTTALPIVMKP
ncbi:carbohydrate binding domain-containing protein [Cohnella sp. NL03-T5]|nr:carbohydrate binding domain-containing protein [Cohnella silvisoli]